MNARQIGCITTLKASIAGLTLAYATFGAFMALDGNYLEALFWIVRFDYWPNLLVGALGILACAYLFGRQAGVAIILNRRNPIWIGIKYSFATLILGTVIGSTVGYLQEGIHYPSDLGSPFLDYYLKPLFWVFMAGLIPTIILGIWMGRRIKKRDITSF